MLSMAAGYLFRDKKKPENDVKKHVHRHLIDVTS